MEGPEVVESVAPWTLVTPLLLSLVLVPQSGSGWEVTIVVGRLYEAAALRLYCPVIHDHYWRQKKSEKLLLFWWSLLFC